MKNIFTIVTLLLLGQFYKGAFPLFPQKETLSNLSGISLYEQNLWGRNLFFKTNLISPHSSMRAPGVPAPLPFFTDFTANEFSFVNGSQTNKWVWGDAVGNTGASMYVSNNNGVANAYTTSSQSTTHAYKELIVPAGSTVAHLTFDWRAAGEANYDYMSVYLAPSTFTPTAGTKITPTSSNRIIRVVTGLRGQNDWTTYRNYTLDISSFAGSNMRLIFEWTNDSSVGTQPPAAVDNVKFEIPSCVSPLNLSTSNLTLNSATLNWGAVLPTPAQGYEYVISTTNTPPDNTTNGTVVSTNTVNLTNLSSGTTYYWWVRSRCVGTDRSVWSEGTPFVLGLIGTGNSVASTLPVAGCYNYSYSQMLYTVTELQGGMGNNRVIKKISYFVNTQPVSQNANKRWKIFLANTTKSVFSNSTDWIPSSQMIEVFDGEVPNMTSGQWVQIEFTVPFIWDGVSNLAIAVDENSNGSSCITWGSYSVGANRGILYRSDTINPDPSSPPTSSSRYTSIPRILLNSDPLPPCNTNPPTNVVPRNITNNSAMLTWNPVDGSGYLLQWRKVTSPASPWTNVTPNPIVSYHSLTGLEEQSNYEFRVANICGSTSGTYSAIVPFTTKPLPYCSAESTTNPVTDYIAEMKISPTGFPVLPEVSSVTGASNYSDYYFDTTKRISLVKGSIGNQITVLKGFTGNTSNMAVSAWIDYDRNGTFENNELIFNTGANATLSVNGLFDVPTTVTNSQYPTRMRVIARRSTSPSSCGNFANGEVEDYAVTFVETIPCNNTAPQNGTITNIGANTATVNWTADPGGANYVIRYKVAGTNVWIDQIPVASLQSSLVINNLLSSTDYEVHVSAICQGTEGNPTILTFSTPCVASSPNNFTISQVTSTSAVANWDAIPSSTYIFQYRAVGTTNWTTINLSANTYALSNLQPYITYEARVASICGGTTSPFSTPQVFRTLPTCDMAPVELTITKLTMTEAKLEWRAIPNTTYVLQWRKVGSNAGWNTINVSTNSYLLTGLVEQTKYEVKIANICNGTQGLFTDVYEFETPSLAYCDMASINSNEDYISNVTVNATGYEEMSNTSNASAYSSFVSLPSAYIRLDRGSQNNRISIQKAWKTLAKAGAVTVWIDFNRDALFTNDERIVISPVNTQETVEATFDVPMNSYVTTSDDHYTMMRVAFSRGNSPAMCDNPQHGEIEDYRVIISSVNQFVKLNAEEINIYPVPVGTTINITRVNDGSKYTIYNTAGQVVQTGQIFNNKVDVTTLSSGVYMIDIESMNAGKAVKKFIKN